MFSNLNSCFGQVASSSGGPGAAAGLAAGAGAGIDLAAPRPK